MDARTQALIKRGCKDVANLDEDIEIENKESELDCERSDTTQYLTQDFFTPLEVQNFDPSGNGKVDIAPQGSGVQNSDEDTLLEVMQVQNNATKEGVRTLCSVW